MGDTEREPETFDLPDSGYPEEGPPGAAPDDDPGTGRESAVREKARPDRAGGPGDDRKATGNPNS